MTSTLWPADLFESAVWESALSTAEKAVALAFADHARDGDTAWVTYERLMRRCSMSRDTVARCLRVLLEAGWLVLVRPAKHHRPALYRLTIPAEQSDGRTADPVDNDVQQSDGRTADDAQQSDGAAQQSDGADSAVRPSDATSLPTSLPTSTPAPDRAPAAPAGGGGDLDEQHLGRACSTLLAAVPGATRTSRVVDGVSGCLRAGWPVEQIVEQVARPSWAGVANRTAVLARRLDDLAGTPVPAPPKPPTPKCADPACGPARRLEDDDGRDLGPCPTCHPSRTR